MKCEICYNSSDYSNPTIPSIKRLKRHLLNCHGVGPDDQTYYARALKFAHDTRGANNKPPQKQHRRSRARRKIK